MSDQKLTLEMKPQSDHMNVVLGTEPILSKYVAFLRPQLKRWPELEWKERVETLTEAANRILFELSIPRPVRIGFTNERMGYFLREKWSITFVRDLFYGEDLDAVSQQAGHVIHEFEHLAATYVAARFLASQQKQAASIVGTLGVLASIAEQAAKAPLPPSLSKLGEDCLYRVTIEKSAGGKDDRYSQLQDEVGRVQLQVSAATKDRDAIGDTVAFDGKKYVAAKKRVADLETKRDNALDAYKNSYMERGSNYVEALLRKKILDLK